MRTPLLTLLLLAAPACQSTHGPIDEWQVLFDGDASGWAMAGPGGFNVDGDSMTAYGGMGLYWYSQAEYEDFHLKFEWKVADKTNNSGVFVRFPYPENDKGEMDPWVAVHQGYEFQICDTGGDVHNTGSAYSFQGVSHMPTKEVGEWNQYEIIAVGQNYTIKINGEIVNEFAGERGTKGYIGLQNHDDGSPVAFRNVNVREL